MEFYVVRTFLNIPHASYNYFVQYCHNFNDRYISGIGVWCVHYNNVRAHKSCCPSGSEHFLCYNLIPALASSVSPSLHWCKNDTRFDHCLKLLNKPTYRCSCWWPTAAEFCCNTNTVTNFEDTRNYPSAVTQCSMKGSQGFCGQVLGQFYIAGIM